MKLSNLTPGIGAKKKSKRVGRGPGSGHGKTSCRGEKGYRARSGSSVKPGFEGGQMPLYRRLPKRGFTNIFRTSYSVVNVGDLDSRFDGGEITPKSMRESGLVSKSRGLVKILGTGDISKKFTVSCHACSATAKEKIEQAGGTVKVIPR